MGSGLGRLDRDRHARGAAADRGALRLDVALLAGALAGACARAHSEAPAAASPTRQPDGVFLDVREARPPAREVALARTVVALSLPVSREEVQSLVRAYFRAFIGGDASAFGAILSRSARHLEGGPSGDLADSLARRLHTVDYSGVSLDAVAGYDDIRIVPHAVAPEEVRGPARMVEGDVWVEVPVRLQRDGVTRLFGSRVVMILRREEEGGAWKIAVVGEDDGPWP